MPTTISAIPTGANNPAGKASDNEARNAKACVLHEQASAGAPAVEPGAYVEAPVHASEGEASAAEDMSAETDDNIICFPAGRDTLLGSTSHGAIAAATRGNVGAENPKPNTALGVATFYADEHAAGRTASLAVVAEEMLSLLDKAKLAEKEACKRILVESGVCTEEEYKAALKAEHKRRRQVRPEEERQSYRDFVRDYIAGEGLTIKLNGQVVRSTTPDPDTVDLTTPKDVNKLFKDMWVHVLDNGLNFQKTGLQYALDGFIDQIREDLLGDIWNEIAYSDEAAKAAAPIWRSLEELVFDVGDGESGFPTAVLQKTIHQVKVKFTGKRVYDHLIAVLVGLQGSGKSEFLVRFLGPIAEEVLPTNFAEISDIRNVQLWQFLVLLLEELDKGEKADITTVKNRATASHIGARVMGTNRQIQVFNRATFIGSSNRSVAEVLTDTTGMRRYAELSWKVGRGDESVFNAINAIDFRLLWRSVDERGPDPITPWKPLLEAKQEEMRVPDEVEEWLLDSHRDANRFARGRSSILSKDWADWKQVSLLYTDHYALWCRNKGRNPVHQCKAFALVMKRLCEQRGDQFGLERKVNGKKPVMYWLKSFADTEGQAEDNMVDSDATTEAA